MQQTDAEAVKWYRKAAEHNGLMSMSRSEGADQATVWSAPRTLHFEKAYLKDGSIKRHRGALRGPGPGTEQPRSDVRQGQGSAAKRCRGTNIFGTFMIALLVSLWEVSIAIAALLANMLGLIGN